LNDRHFSYETLIYPNPVNRSFKIDFGEIAGNYTIIVNDLNGKCILKRDYKSILNIEIDANGWNKGIYLLSILENSESRYSQRIAIP